MSNASVAAAKADVWFNQYLELGEGRSLRLLAAKAPLLCSEGVGGAPPPERTLFSWSARYGWDRRAKAHDTQLRAQARDQVLREQATTATERAGVALGSSMAFHALVRDALTHREPRMDPQNPEEQLIQVADGRGLVPVFDYRPKTWDEVRPDVYAIAALHGMAIATEKQYLGDAVERYHTHITDGESKAPVIEILGREAVTDMGISIGKMVRKLGAITDVKRAELAAQGEKEAPREIESEPEIEWEEVTDE